MGIQGFSGGEEFKEDEAFGSVLKGGPEDEIRAAQGGGFLRCGLQEEGGGYGKVAEDGKDSLLAPGKDDLGGDIILHFK